MPNYDYACQACNHRFELTQSFSEDPISLCPICDRQEVKKVFAVPAIAFKGSGFYKTDSRSKSKAASKSGGSKNSTEGSSSTSSESTKDSKSQKSSESKKSSETTAPKSSGKNSSASTSD